MCRGTTAHCPTLPTKVITNSPPASFVRRYSWCFSLLILKSGRGLIKLPLKSPALIKGTPSETCSPGYMTPTEMPRSSDNRSPSSTTFQALGKSSKPASARCVRAVELRSIPIIQSFQICVDGFFQLRRLGKPTLQFSYEAIDFFFERFAIILDFLRANVAPRRQHMAMTGDFF